MIGDAESFILDVRKAVRLAEKPFPMTPAERWHPDTEARFTAHLSVWLNRGLIEQYNPVDFADRPLALRQELQDAVNGFRDATASALPKSSTNGNRPPGQYLAFIELTIAVRKIVQWEWTEAANSLIDRIESWAADSDWVVRRTHKPLDETLLGQYSLGKLELYAEGNRYLLDPLARFVHGALGAFNLSLLPTSSALSIYRKSNGVWYIETYSDLEPEGFQTEHSALTRESFSHALTELLALV